MDSENKQAEPAHNYLTDTSTQALIKTVESLQREVKNLGSNLSARIDRLEQPAQTPESLGVGGFTFYVKTLPKQDVMMSGVNSPGRNGLMVILNDGVQEFSVAKLEWDHQKQGFVLFTGRGV